MAAMPNSVLTKQLLQQISYYVLSVDRRPFILKPAASFISSQQKN
jgi:hypothetical protein